ncbi:MAG TPA: TlpA disulfide reductase family protein [Xanthobacteraceae bacterium]|nr:TlpA disulfide reductase family protein [Xanthobacteraceae bacterium]
MSAPQPPASPGRKGRKKTLLTVLAAALLGTAAGLAVYGIGGFERNGAAKEADAACKDAVAVAKKLAPLARGEVAAFSAATTPRRLPELKFTNAEGRPVTLADFRGKVTLLNLWATWCVPCRKEMPALDALEGKLGGADFAVLAINLDTGDRAKPKKFLSEIGVKHLAYYEDPTTDVFQDLKRYGRSIIGLPATVLIGRDGCELGVLPGPAEWSSEDALNLIRAATGSKP